MQRLLLVALLAIALGHDCASNTQKCPVAKTSLGKVSGLSVLADVSSYCSFIGIHYAKDTSGNQRFKPPEPVEPWTGILRATRQGPVCPQYPFLDTMNEDCLLLNIHTPHSFNRGPLRPVLFWIHGGEFRFGNANIGVYGPQYIMRNNVVIVVIQYRLGSFGFLNVNLPEAAGNMGLKDQVMALRWVHKNIHAFGGDPNQVTVFGQSAGAISITALILSPTSQGLFKNAILMSGSILGYRFFNTKPEPFAFKLGVQLGLNTVDYKPYIMNYTTDPKKLIDYIRNFTASQLVDATMAMEYTDNFQRGYNNYIPFVTSIDQKFEGLEAFLPEHPLALMRKGDYKRVPCMIGFTDKEGIKVFEQLTGHETEYLSSINVNFTKTVAPNDIPDDEDPNTLAQQIREFYFGNLPVGVATLENYIRMATDSWYVHPTDYFLRYQEIVGNNQPVYYYEFAFDRSFNFFKKNINSNYPGACHADDLGYLWHSTLLNKAFDGSGVSEIVRDRHIRLFLNFAVYSNPTPYITNEIPKKWQPIEYPNMRYMLIGKDLQMIDHSPRRKATILWQDIYELPRI